MNNTSLRKSTPKAYGAGFCSRPYSSIDKMIRSLKGGRADMPNTRNPCYESFLLSSLWYHICQHRWPHLSITEKSGEETAGALVIDWTREFLLLGTRFDLGPFEVMVGVRTPIATNVSLRRELSETVYLAVAAEDQQSAEDIMNEESMTYLRDLLYTFDKDDSLVDFARDCFFVYKAPHTGGLYACERLLDLLESIYTSNAPLRDN